MARRIAARSVAIAVVAATMTALVTGACGGDGAIDPAPPSPEASPSEASAEGGNDAPVASPFGLDTRPPNPSCRAPARPPALGPVKLEPQFTSTPMFPSTMIAQIPGDKSRIFLAAIHGEIFSFSKASPPTTTPPVVLTLPPPSTPTGQLTLLGFAFHPKFATNGFAYVTFTTDGGAGPSGARSVVARYKSTDNGASFGGYTEIISYDQTGTHNGGGIAFGNDGLLYLSFGDGGDGDDNQRNGQKTTGFFSKIVRIDVDSPPAPGLAYAIPDGNPFKSGGGEPAAYAYGFRNPFRISIDRATGDLWIGDVGQEGWEEIDKLVAPGGNHGWPCREGTHAYLTDDERCPSGTSNLVDPVFEYPATGGASVTGGVVYRGASIPSLVGSYVYGDYITGQIWSLDVDPATGALRNTLLNASGPTGNWAAFSEDDDGEIYAIDLGAKIYKLLPSGTPQPSTFPDRLSKTGCFEAADPKKPVAALIPYGVNAELWSDGASKDRWLALPDGKTIARAADDDLDLPNGSVLFKSFSLSGKPVETRMLVRHDDGGWAGYSYEWNAEGTDAALLASSKKTSAWVFPGRGECLGCHTKAAGGTLGLEIGQLNRDFVYASTGRISNQLATLDHIGMLSAPLGSPSALAALPSPAGTGPVEPRARAYLHANCSSCHRSDNVVSGGGAFDLRFTTSFASTKTCNAAATAGDLGIADARIIAPGAPAKSVLLQRMRSATGTRMPRLASRVVDTQGTGLVESWIQSIATCP